MGTVSLMLFSSTDTLKMALAIKGGVSVQKNHISRKLFFVTL